MKNSSKNVSPHAIGHSNKKSNYNSGPTADDIILGSSSKPTKKRTDHGEKVKGNNVLPHAIGNSNKKKMLSDSSLKNKSEEVVEHNSTPTVYDIILDSSSKPDEKGTDHGENVKVLSLCCSDLSLPVPMSSFYLTPSLSLSLSLCCQWSACRNCSEKFKENCFTSCNWSLQQEENVERFQFENQE